MCVIAERLGSTGLHMYQDMGISRAPSHRGAPTPLLETAHRANLYSKIGESFLPRQRCSPCELQRVFSRPAGRHFRVRGTCTVMDDES